MQKKNWYETWFNSRYYDLLYKNRDNEEAAAFINALLAHLKPPPQATMLDVACGKGRHAKYLAAKGYDVTGIDLSFKNIREASVYENSSLSFFQHDMRMLFRVNYFDYTFNFFTSIGYFENKKDNLKIIQSMSTGLKAGGKIIIDFFNTNYVLSHLVDEEIKIVDSVEFKISRVGEHDFIFKNIHINDCGHKYVYTEKVAALSLSDFIFFMDKANLKIKTIFGDYALNPYDEKKSKRLIIIAEK